MSKMKFAIWLSVLAGLMLLAGAFALHSQFRAAKVGFSQSATIGGQTMLFQEMCVKGHMMLVGGYATSITMVQLWENTPKGPQPVECK